MGITFAGSWFRFAAFDSHYSDTGSPDPIKLLALWKRSVPGFRLIQSKTILIQTAVRQWNETFDE